jgi:hypothetical protein
LAARRPDAAVAVSAHHSFAAEFDITKPVTLTARITKIEWTNPHAFLFIDVQDKQTGPSPTGKSRWAARTV